MQRGSRQYALGCLRVRVSGCHIPDAFLVRSWIPGASLVRRTAPLDSRCTSDREYGPVVSPWAPSPECDLNLGPPGASDQRPSSRAAAAPSVAADLGCAAAGVPDSSEEAAAAAAATSPREHSAHLATTADTSDRPLTSPVPTERSTDRTEDTTTTTTPAGGSREVEAWRTLLQQQGLMEMGMEDTICYTWSLAISMSPNGGW